MVKDRHRVGATRVVEVAPARPCEVLIDGRWWAGLLSRWLQYPDGSWWGLGQVEWHEWREPKRFPDELRPARPSASTQNFERTSSSARHRSVARRPDGRRIYTPPLPVRVRLDGQWRNAELTEAQRDSVGEWWGWGHAKNGRWNRWVPFDRIKPLTEPPA